MRAGLALVPVDGQRNRESLVAFFGVRDLTASDLSPFGKQRSDVAVVSMHNFPKALPGGLQ